MAEAAEAPSSNASSEIEIIRIEDVDYRLEPAKQHEYQEVVDMFMKAMAEGDGLSKHEFESEEAVWEYLNRGPVIVLKQSPSEQVIGFATIRKSPLVRTENSMYNAGYMILKKEARKKGLASRIVQRAHHNVQQKYGFVATVARTATVSKALQMVARNQWTILGTIPNSMFFPQYGWVDDLVCYSSTEAENEADLPMFQDPKTIPPLKDPNYTFLLNEHRLNKIYLPQLVYDHWGLTVGFATKDDVIPVEEMIREAALEGLGFAADEFNTDGYLNRCLLLRSHMLVIKSANGTIIAAIVFGPTAICREKTMNQVGGYLVIRKSMRGKGLGSAILDYCLKNIERMGYGAILTDVFASNLPALKMLQKRGFMATATVPNSGFINGQGRVHTYLMYKQRRNMKQSARL